MKTRKISLPIIIVSLVAFMMIATGIASWIITISKDFTLEYSKEGEIISSLDCSSVVYDGNVHLPTVKSDAAINFTDVDVFSTYKFEFRKKGTMVWTTILFDTAYKPSLVNNNAPMNAGTYEVRYTDSSNFSVIVDFTINKATPTVNNIATLGTTIYGTLPTITQPTSTPATYILFDGSTENVAGSFAFVDEESTRFNSTVRNYSGTATATTATTSLLFVPESENYNSVEVDQTFTAEAVAYCSTTYYCTIEKALEANTSSGTIFVIIGKNPSIYESCSVGSGVTLSIPYSAELIGNTDDEIITGNSGYARDKASSNKKNEVTIQPFVKITVLGTLNIGGIRSGGGGNQMAGQTATSYTQIVMSEGAIIECSGTINCCGYIIGVYGNNKSQVNMKNGGVIYMPFVVQEHRGGSMFVDMAHLSGITPNLKTSPFNRFHFNNVESYLSFEYGSKLIGMATLATSKLIGSGTQPNPTNISIIGPNNDNTTYMVEMVSGSFIETKYVHSTQIIDLDSYGGFSLNPLEITINYIMTVTLSTEKVYIPISWYFNISLHNFQNGNSATYDLTNQKIKLLPGAKLKVDTGVTVNAGEIVMYSSIPVDTTGAPKYPTVYPSGVLKDTAIPAAVIILNGLLTTEKIGGLVISEVEGAKLSVTTDSSVTTQELISSGPTYETKKEKLKAYIYNNGNINDYTSTLAKGTYFSKRGELDGEYGWYSETLTIFYNANGGEFAGESSEGPYETGQTGYEISSLTQENTIPTRDHYTFTGWYADEEGTILIAKYNSSSLTKWTYTNYVAFTNINIYAGWEPINYTISYEYQYHEDASNTGTIDESSLLDSFNITTNTSLPKPTHSNNYVFDGWYLDSDLTMPIANLNGKDYVDDGSLKLYGLWYPKGTQTYAIDYIMVNNSKYSVTANFSQTDQIISANASKYLVPADYTDLNNDVSTPYYFVGWFVDEEGTIAFNASSHLSSTSTYIKSRILTTEDGTEYTEKYIEIFYIFDEKAKIEIIDYRPSINSTLVERGNIYLLPGTYTFDNLTSSENDLIKAAFTPQLTINELNYQFYGYNTSTTKNALTEITIVSNETTTVYLHYLLLVDVTINSSMNLDKSGWTSISNYKLDSNIEITIGSNSYVIGTKGKNSEEKSYEVTVAEGTSYTVSSSTKSDYKGSSANVTRSPSSGTVGTAAEQTITIILK